jgi:hypothetical protein
MKRAGLRRRNHLRLKLMPGAFACRRRRLDAPCAAGDMPRLNEPGVACFVVADGQMTCGMTQLSDYSNAQHRI